MTERLDPVTLSVLAQRAGGHRRGDGRGALRGAYSSNIKERRDCSAALFDAAGRMVAQAEHIPVHLGAMPEAVAAAIAREPRPGDVFVLNDPYTRRHPPARHHAGLADGGRGPIVGYAVDAGPPLRHRRHAARARCRADSRETLAGGPDRSRRSGWCAAGEPYADVLALMLANSRTPAARGRPARPARRQPAGRGRLASSSTGRGPRSCVDGVRRVLAYAERRTREAAARRCRTARYRSTTSSRADGVVEPTSRSGAP